MRRPFSEGDTPPLIAQAGDCCKFETTLVYRTRPYLRRERREAEREEKGGGRSGGGRQRRREKRGRRGKEEG